VYAPFLHDVVYLYAVIVDEMIQLVLDKRHLIRCELARRGVRRGVGRLVTVDEMIQLDLDYRHVIQSCPWVRLTHGLGWVVNDIMTLF